MQRIDVMFSQKIDEKTKDRIPADMLRQIHLQMYFIGFPVASLVDQSGQDVERGLCFVGIYFSLQHIFDLSSVFIGETVPVEGLMVIFSSGLKKTTALPHRA